MPVIDLAARSADPLRWHQRVAVLDGSGVDAPRPGTTPAPAYRPLLDRAERMLLVAPIAAPDNAWTQFCLQQGDRLLAIAHEEMPAGTPPRPELHRCDLVAYEVAPGSGALAGWAESLEPVETHALSVDPELEADVTRLPRRLRGRSLAPSFRTAERARPRTSGARGAHGRGAS